MRWLLLLVLAILGLSGAAGYPVGVITLEGFEAAPVLVTGRVTAIQNGAVVREPEVSSQKDLIEATAVVDVLRSRSASENLPAPGPLQTIFVRFYVKPGEPESRMSGPALPLLKAGDIYVFPLRAREGALWRLSFDQGSEPVIQATAKGLEPLTDPQNHKDYLLSEIAGVLAHGIVPEIRRANGQILTMLSEPHAAELHSRIFAEIGEDRRRWALISAVLMCDIVIPSEPPYFLAYLRAAPLEGEGTGNQRRQILAWASRHLPDSEQTDEALVKILLTTVPMFLGRAAPLLEVDGDPRLISGVRNALEGGAVGSVQFAWELVRAGQAQLLPEALAEALRAADRPDSDVRDLNAAGWFVRDFGSEEQLRAYAALVRKYRQDDTRYSRLWQHVALDGARNSPYVLAVVLEDRRVAFRTIRYCDLAVSYLERATGEDFGSEVEGPMPARDRSVQRARAWLREHGYLEQL